MNPWDLIPQRNLECSVSSQLRVTWQADLLDLFGTVCLHQLVWYSLRGAVVEVGWGAMRQKGGVRGLNLNFPPSPTVTERFDTYDHVYDEV